MNTIRDAQRAQTGGRALSAEPCFNTSSESQDLNQDNSLHFVMTASGASTHRDTFMDSNGKAVV